MARSTNIWIVANGDPRDEPLINAFTVKHEMLDWLGLEVEAGLLLPETDWYILKVRDGVDWNDPHARPDNNGAPRAYDFWKESLS